MNQIERTLYWCDLCRTPLAAETTITCPGCNGPTRSLTPDARPVFARERMILACWRVDDYARPGAIIDEYYKLLGTSVWKADNNYVLDGVSYIPPRAEKVAADLDSVAETVRRLPDATYDDMDARLIIPHYRMSLATANAAHLAALEDDSFAFVRATAERYARRLHLVSFSGGKDSTVVSELVRRALGRSDILHVFGDTTLEDENTYAYVRAFREENPLVPFFEAKAEHDFHELVETMGPPSRVMRWCCTIFKAGPINNLLQTLGEDGKTVKVLTFYGIRNDESARRADYNAITVGAKIGTQITASPIIKWRDFDVWLYILAHGITFNKSYRLGYSRVGCWLCPLNSHWSESLAKIFFPEDAARWTEQLQRFAAKVGKPDPEEYVASGSWKARFGGAGMPNSFGGLEEKPCGERDFTLTFTVGRPVTDELYEFFKPLGRLNFEKGRKALGEFFVEPRKASPLQAPLLVQAPLGGDQVRVTVLDTTNFEATSNYVRHQIGKFQTCIQCTACAAVCPFGAITVRPEQRVYTINADKCTGCLECVNHFGSTGCLVAKSLSVFGEHREKARAMKTLAMAHTP